jgi:hypothetical protein
LVEGAVLFVVTVASTLVSRQVSVSSIVFQSKGPPKMIKSLIYKESSPSIDMVKVKIIFETPDWDPFDLPLSP